MDKKQKIAIILLPVLAIVILIGGIFISNRSKEGSAKTYADGIYTGEGKGFGGDIKVEVEVSGGKITSIDLLEHGESAGISDPAIEGIPKAIINAQDTEVNAVSGATFTSKGIMEAVENALAGEPGTSQKEEKPAPKKEEKEPEITQDISDMNLADGTYEGTGKGFGGSIKVEVKVEDGKVANIEILEHGETANISDPAIEGMPKAIVEAQSIKVDTVSGATTSSKGIVKAVEDALSKAKAKPGYKDGIHEGTGRGFGGNIKVEVEVKDGKIVNVEILEHGETANISDPAIEGIPKAIVEAQSTEVDTVSGATTSSKGIIKAVEDALK